jgi:hypothetical protein
VGEHERDPNRWPARPVLGAALHGLLLIVPVLLGIAAGFATRRALPPEGLAGVPPWVVAGALGTAVVWAAQLLARRITPLSWLLRIGMLFPGPAPSRFRVAREAGRLRRLEDRLAGAAEAPEDVAAQRSAEMILSLVAALTAHDRRTRGHSERVRVFTDLLSEEMGLPQEDRDRLRWAALLHDVGKLEVSERILNKPGKPTEAEWVHLRRHPAAGDRMIAPMRDWLGRWADTVLHHHERWDGTGYPSGLAGEEISLGARIVSVADAYDVMTAARSYKRPSSVAHARNELVACAGSQFDPAVVRAFLLVPLPRLRWALGPFAWVAQLPWAREVVHVGAQVPVAAGSAAAAVPAAAGAATVATGMAFTPGLGAVYELPPTVIEQTGDEELQDDAGIGVVRGEGARTAEEEPDGAPPKGASTAGSDVDEETVPETPKVTPSEGSEVDGKEKDRAAEERAKEPTGSSRPAETKAPATGPSTGNDRAPEEPAEPAHPPAPPRDGRPGDRPGPEKAPAPEPESAPAREKPADPQTSSSPAPEEPADPQTSSSPAPEKPAAPPSASSPAPTDEVSGTADVVGARADVGPADDGPARPPRG